MGEKMELQSKSILRGNERILFVDDNETVVNVVELMLKHLGYRVISFTDAREAVRVFSEKPSEFDLVIIDYVMPHLTGMDVAEKVRRIRSDIPMILCTAYSDSISKEKAWAIGFRGFILKPFDYRKLAELVRGVLDGVPDNEEAGE